MSDLTERDRDVYEYIKAFAVKNGILPSNREIGAGVGLKSTSSVHCHMKNLEEKGYIVRDAYKKWYRVKGLRYIDESI